MKIVKRIYFRNNKKKYSIDFGIPITPKDFKEMFELRYKIYADKDYIYKEDFKNFLEKDKYDEDNKCIYFIAKINNETAGSLRLIKDNFLPAEKECFRFNEPYEMKNIPRAKRIEVGRLVVEKYKINNKFLPRHLILIGLLSSAIDYCLGNDIKGGYAFIKSSLNKKLINIKIPFHEIDNYKKIYRQRLLEKYFNDVNDPVIPIFFIVEELSQIFEKIFKSRFLFKKYSNNEYEFKELSKIKLLLSKLI